MKWHEACFGSSVVTSRYNTVPLLDPFPIYDCELESGAPSFNVCGWLPQLPDDTRLAEGLIPDRADLFLSFMNIEHLRLSGVPDKHGGELTIVKDNESSTRFEYESEAFRFGGVCKQAVIGGVGVQARHDPNRREPRGPRLFSHPNVFNSCLLLLQEYGYSLHATGHIAHGDYPTRLRWHAKMTDGTNLSGDSPIELLGLACLHRHHTPKVDEPYWWRIDGSPLLTELIDEWKQRSDPTHTSHRDATR